MPLEQTNLVPGPKEQQLLISADNFLPSCNWDSCDLSQLQLDLGHSRQSSVGWARMTDPPPFLLHSNQCADPANAQRTTALKEC